MQDNIGLAVYFCPLCKSESVQVAFPAWHSCTDGELRYLETDEAASVLYWHCAACDVSGSGEPGRKVWKRTAE